MNNNELKLLWAKYKKTGDEQSKNKLVEHYFYYVRKISKHLAIQLSPHVQADELASYGVDGLYGAIDKFDFSQGVKFETYAYPRIWGSMMDAIRKVDWVPRSVRLRQNVFDNTRSNMEQEKGREVSTDEVLDKLGIKTDYHKQVSKFNAVGMSSIETSTSTEFESDETNKDCNDALCSYNVSSPDSHMLRKEFLGKLIGKDVTPVERKIIYYHYYLDMTLLEIAEKLNVSESLVCQMHNKLLQRLRTRQKLNPDYFADVLKYLSKTNDSSILF